MEEEKSILEIFAEKIITDAKDFITSEDKRAFIVALHTKVIPALKAVVSPMLEECENQGKTETGWCRFRDLYFFPSLSVFSFWLIDKILTKMEEADNTKVEEADKG